MKILVARTPYMNSGLTGALGVVPCRSGTMNSFAGHGLPRWRIFLGGIVTDLRS